MLYFLYKLPFLIVLEMILGIENVLFVNVMADRVLEEDQRRRLRYLGLLIACVLRLVLLVFISWIVKLDKPIFTVHGIDCSWKRIIMLIGGTFLIYKSVMEFYHTTYPASNDAPDTPEEQTYNFNRLLLEIIFIDLVFSIEAIITTVGVVTDKWMIYTAIIVSVIIMKLASDFIGEFIHQNPPFKILGLYFLMMIGVVLAVEGIGFTIPSYYVHGSMGIAFLITVIQTAHTNWQMLSQKMSNQHVPGSNYVQDLETQNQFLNSIN